MKKVIINLIVIMLFSVIAIFMSCTKTYAAGNTGDLELVLDVDDTLYDVSAEITNDSYTGVLYLFEVELKDTEGNPVNATYNATITDHLGTKNESVIFKDGYVKIEVFGADATVNIAENQKDIHIQ